MNFVCPATTTTNSYFFPSFIYCLMFYSYLILYHLIPFIFSNTCLDYLPCSQEVTSVFNSKKRCPQSTQQGHPSTILGYVWIM